MCAKIKNNKNDITNRLFGYLTAKSQRNGDNWEFQCACGNTVVFDKNKVIYSGAVIPTCEKQGCKYFQSVIQSKLEENKKEENVNIDNTDNCVNTKVNEKQIVLKRPAGYVGGFVREDIKTDVTINTSDKGVSKEPTSYFLSEPKRINVDAEGEGFEKDRVYGHLTAKGCYGYMSDTQEPYWGIKCDCGKEFLAIRDTKIKEFSTCCENPECACKAESQVNAKTAKNDKNEPKNTIRKIKYIWYGQKKQEVGSKGVIAKDITGNQYGKLTALKFVEQTSEGDSVWLFKCGCGNFVELLKAAVMYGHITCCEDSDCEFHMHKSKDIKVSELDLSKYKFGGLQPLEIYKDEDTDNPVWLCKCDCGKHAEFTVRDLIYDQVKSCGKNGCKN